MGYLSKSRCAGRAPGPPHRSAVYEAAGTELVSLPVTEPNTPLMLVPRLVIATVAASATSAASNAYSMRSWPSSARTNDFTKLIIDFMSVSSRASLNDAHPVCAKCEHAVKRDRVTTQV